MKKSLLFLLVSISFLSANAGNKIKYYFNQPVDTSVAAVEKAVYLHNCIADTLAAYLNRAKYSLDICVYDFEKTYSYNIYTIDTLFAPKIAEAINSAYNRGVVVRYIYEASNANTGLSLLDTAHIHTLGSPQGSNYTIMHNKFVVIDGNSSNPNDAIVWTGCLNWYVEQFNWDFNNVVVFQDSALAHAYIGEFNMMWGGSGSVPDKTTSKFGKYKTDLGKHIFTIEGNKVELYFSPSDGTDSHIQSTISTADTDLYFGMYTFTVAADANLIMTKKNAGVYVAGLDDSWSNTYSPAATFNSGLGANFKVYTETDTSIYHNKFLIVDPSDICSDPTVLTGSHNWSSSANTSNDENTVIIHNDTAANLFYQYFKASFNSLGGTLIPKGGCKDTIARTGVAATPPENNSVTVYPNPAEGNVFVSYQLSAAQNVTVEVYNMVGQKTAALVNNEPQSAGTHTYNYALPCAGIYIVRVITGSEITTKRIIAERQ